ncbi:MAG: type II secretion system F family protein [Patescibacteria group bacterium]|nr:type II secretion system F family protein [Patescibacteria group bacterium]MDD5294959.1 type II secretion system F family protein [Patescibacteria group bacterium]MDD5554225.1 type II secretion system F family protein [Patescibacteria group bacterium]
MAINLSTKTSNQESSAVIASKPAKDRGNGQEDKKKKPESGESLMDKINNLLLVFSRVPLKEKLFFVQYLGIMLKSGISLASGLKTLSAQSANKRFAKIIGEIAASVEKGTSFTESLKPHQKIFGELFINMIEAGEVSGKLENVLVQLYTQLKKQNELVSKVKGAMTYPAVIIVAMGGIGAFMMIKIVPQMIGMLKEFNAELPLPTKILISVSDALVNNGLLAAGVLVVSILIIIQIMRTYKGRYYWQTIVLHMPIISPIVKKVNLAKFSRTVSTLLKTDIMIIKTFQITANVLGNLHYRKAVNEMAERIKKGSQINEVVSSYPKLFPPVVNQIISVGEETGELDNILTELADFYEGEVDKIMDNLPSIIEPLLILILGCAVGGMAVAIIMPMYSMGSAI